MSRSGRQQHRVDVVEGISVTGWNAHRYQHGHRVSPPHVSLQLRRWGDDERPEFDTTVTMSPALARRTAEALTAAADAAEATPATDDNIVDPGVR